MSAAGRIECFCNVAQIVAARWLCPHKVVGKGRLSVLPKVPKPAPQWWKRQDDGKLLLTVRYGAKAIEFEQGKDAVLLADVRELVAVLPKLIAATGAGELDYHINAVTKAKQPFVMRR